MTADARPTIFRCTPQPLCVVAAAVPRSEYEARPQLTAAGDSGGYHSSLAGYNFAKML